MAQGPTETRRQLGHGNILAADSVRERQSATSAASPRVVVFVLSVLKLELLLALDQQVDQTFFGLDVIFQLETIREQRLQHLALLIVGRQLRERRVRLARFRG